MANRRTRTSSADGQLYIGDTAEPLKSPSLSSVDHTATPMSHARSTSKTISSIENKY